MYESAIHEDFLHTVDAITGIDTRHDVSSRISSHNIKLNFKIYNSYAKHNSHVYKQRIEQVLLPDVK